MCVIVVCVVALCVLVGDIVSEAILASSQWSYGCIISEYAAGVFP